LVWMIGYQDHRWRSTGLATLAAALLIGASAALVIAARTEDRQATTAGWPLVALAVSSVSLLLAWFWGLMG